MIKFKIGDKIKFINTNCGIFGITIPNYRTDVPGIIHGSTILKKNEGKIIEKIDKNFYLVEFIDNYDHNVRLGFNIKDLTLKEPIYKNVKELNLDYQKYDTI